MISRIVGVILAITLVTATTTATGIYPSYAWIEPDTQPSQKAPPAISGENVYVVWWTDEGTPNSNGEVIFRASTDGGATFGNKTNLSNTNTTDSVDAEIDSDADSVVVTWWEKNQTTNAPVMRVSTDNGATFGPLVALATNGTIGEAAEEPEEGEAE
jgi:hypothetical protein